MAGYDAPRCCGIDFNNTGLKMRNGHAVGYEDEFWDACTLSAHPLTGVCTNFYTGGHMSNWGEGNLDEMRQEYQGFIYKNFPYKIENEDDGEDADWEIDPSTYTPEQQAAYWKANAMRVKIQWAVARQMFGSKRAANKYADRVSMSEEDADEALKDPMRVVAARQAAQTRRENAAMAAFVGEMAALRV
jgi:hypothetical protein